MILLQTPIASPAVNLAREEALFLYEKEDYTLLWRNHPSVIIGRNQDPAGEIDLAYAAAHHIDIARRITGGGAVYHDEGNMNLSYLFTCQADGSDFDDKVKLWLDILIAYLQSVGLSPALTGRNDICLVDDHGQLRKIAGTAMSQRGERGLFHLCLLFDADMEHMEKVLTPPAEKLASHGVTSVRSRTINLKAVCPALQNQSAEEIFADLVSWFSDWAEEGTVPSDITSSINDLITSKYSQHDWTYNRTYRKE